MFDTAKIMKKAWELFRKEWIGARPANAVARMKSFARCLKSAWMTAKFEAAEAAKTATQEVVGRIEAFRLELMRVDARSLRYSNRADRLAILAAMPVLAGERA
jgi:hypothetical protein